MTERELFKEFYGLFRLMLHWDAKRNVQKFFLVKNTMEAFERKAKESGMTTSQIVRVANCVVTATENKSARLREPSKNSLSVQLRVYSQHITSSKADIMEVFTFSRATKGVSA